MYASFFGLRELPFNNTPDPRFFFSTPEHEEALASLIYAIAEGKGFVLLTGEVGSGKTLVTRLMLKHFGESIVFAGINNTQVTAGELLEGICTEFDIAFPPRAGNIELIRRLQDFLLLRFADNRPVVLMLDEAQALSDDAFEQVRMINNLEADDAKLLQIVIVGQTELRTRFDTPGMRQLRQRLFRSFHLAGLTAEQTPGYIRHRLGVAGAAHPERIILDDAIALIHDYSHGLPRLINTICDNAMLSAYAADRHSLDRPFLEDVLAQINNVERYGELTARSAGRSTVRPGETFAPAVDGAPVGDVVRHELERQQRQLVELMGAEMGRLRTQLVEEMALRTDQRIVPPDGRPGSQPVGQVQSALVDLVERATKVGEKVRNLISECNAAAAQGAAGVAELKAATGALQRLTRESREHLGRLDAAVSRAGEIERGVDLALARLADGAESACRLSAALCTAYERLDSRRPAPVVRRPPAGPTTDDAGLSAATPASVPPRLGQTEPCPIDEVSPVVQLSEQIAALNALISDARRAGRRPAANPATGD